MIPPGGTGGPSVGPLWTPMEAISFGWKVVTKRFSTVAIPLAVGVIILAFLANIVSIGGSFAIRILAEQGLLDSSLLPFASMSVSALGGIVSLFVSSFMSPGFVTLGLKACRGQPTSFGDVFSGGRYMMQFLIASIVGGIVIGIGMMLCLVPGIILAFGLSLQSYLIVDGGLSGVDALKKSWEMTKGHRLNIFIFGLIGFCVYLAGLIACVVGALLISAPVLMVGFSWVYLRIKGEGVPEPT